MAEASIRCEARTSHGHHIGRASRKAVSEFEFRYNAKRDRRQRSSVLIVNPGTEVPHLQTAVEEDCLKAKKR
jgi:hypothetical protein